MSGNPFRKSQQPYPAASEGPNAAHHLLSDQYPPQLPTSSDEGSASTPPPGSKSVRIHSPPRSPSPASRLREGTTRDGRALARRVSASSHSGSPPPPALPSPDSSDSDSPAGEFEDPFNRDGSLSNSGDEANGPDMAKVVARNTRRNSMDMRPAAPSRARQSMPQRPNPFQRTLASMEHGVKHVSFSDERPTDIERELAKGTHGTEASRATMDMDSFKRLLLTGSASADEETSATVKTLSAEPGASSSSFDRATPNTSRPTFSTATGDGGTTDALSVVSRHGSSEYREGPHSDTVHSSYEAPGEDEDDRGRSTGSRESRGLSGEGKKKPPPPPTRRHGKATISPDPRQPQTVSFSDFSASLTSVGPTSPKTENPTSASTLKASLSKPLPATPPPIAESSSNLFLHSESQHSPSQASTSPADSASHSPNRQETKRRPPVVPLARRYSKRTTTGGDNHVPPPAESLPSSDNQTRSRSNSNLTHTSFSTTGVETSTSADASSLHSNSHGQKPPPPPPTRRTTGSSHAVSATSGAGTTLLATTKTLESSHDTMLSSTPPKSALQQPSPQHSDPINIPPSPHTRPRRASSSTSSSLRNAMAMGPPPTPPRRRGAGGGGAGSGTAAVVRMSSSESGRGLTLGGEDESVHGEYDENRVTRKGNGGAGASTSASASLLPPSYSYSQSQSQMAQITQSGMASSSMEEREGEAEGGGGAAAAAAAAAAAPDILADMTAFQREVDALRERFGGPGGTTSGSSPG